MLTREQSRQRRHGRTRKKLAGSAERPRISVFRSLNHLYVQAIDDDLGATLAALHTSALKGPEGGSVKAAQSLGKAFGTLLLKKGIKKVVFDRSGYLYHGRVKALADQMREVGISF